MFTQSNLGIVTEATLALKRKPEPERSCLFGVKISSLKSMSEVVGVIQSVMQRYEGLLSCIQFMNRDRVYSMRIIDTISSESEYIPKDKKGKNERAIPEWTVVGCIYCSADILKHINNDIKSNLPTGLKIVYSDSFLYKFAG